MNVVQENVTGKEDINPDSPDSPEIVENVLNENEIIIDLNDLAYEDIQESEKSESEIEIKLITYLLLICFMALKALVDAVLQNTK